MKKQTIFFVISALILACTASKDNVIWLGWEAGEKKVAENSKKAIVWVYDPGCPNQYLNQHFIPIKLSGKRKEPITTKGRTYYFRSGLNGYHFHDLAQGITQSKETISYPQIVFLNEKRA